ncbi:hypothetical protein AX774_g3897 [Zancudomyces culisetae]|uniref:Uncharacterized protein n=1 Tax=Zancudomyces culisetae TaxID=1213189 RepID=A0A1R1PNT0_ZANCU|nr:hypothetical protein AX774_g4601 [Zancudomyces culisetae]OMH82618.1 hypothetical protein AX774_g3897 [Zancudomyces culisetae]|eukprot:OMH81930.1 hypothetical protein AX774_g4601 [Zancudomyces culisetae]
MGSGKLSKSSNPAEKQKKSGNIDKNGIAKLKRLQEELDTITNLRKEHGIKIKKQKKDPNFAPFDPLQSENKENIEGYEIGEDIDDSDVSNLSGVSGLESYSEHESEDEHKTEEGQDYFPPLPVGTPPNIESELNSDEIWPPYPSSGPRKGYTRNKTYRPHHPRSTQQRFNPNAQQGYVQHPTGHPPYSNIAHIPPPNFPYHPGQMNAYPPIPPMPHMQHIPPMPYPPPSGPFPGAPPMVPPHMPPHMPPNLPPPHMLPPYVHGFQPYPSNHNHPHGSDVAARPSLEQSAQVAKAYSREIQATVLQAEPKIRDLKKELTAFVPQSIQKKKLEQSKTNKFIESIGAVELPKVVVNTAPDVDDSDSEDATEHKARFEGLSKSILGQSLNRADLGTASYFTFSTTSDNPANSHEDLTGKGNSKKGKEPGQKPTSINDDYSRFMDDVSDLL